MSKKRRKLRSRKILKKNFKAFTLLRITHYFVLCISKYQIRFLVRKQSFKGTCFLSGKVKIVDLKTVIEDAFVCCVTLLIVKVLFKLLFFKLVSDCLMSIERVLTNLTTKEEIGDGDLSFNFFLSSFSWLYVAFVTLF